jgi:hypothetical protein
MVVADFFWDIQDEPVLEAIRFAAWPACGGETAANRRGLDPDATPPADATAEGEFRAQATTRIHFDAKLAFAVGE